MSVNFVSAGIPVASNTENLLLVSAIFLCSFAISAAVNFSPLSSAFFASSKDFACSACVSARVFCLWPASAAPTKNRFSASVPYLAMFSATPDFINLCASD